MNFEDFKAVVMEVAPGKRWLHVLPAVPEWYRQRFVDVLKAGAKIPQAYDVVMNNRNVTDEAFYTMLKNYKPKP
jgi:hypothetical protein